MHIVAPSACLILIFKKVVYDKALTRLGREEAER